MPGRRPRTHAPEGWPGPIDFSLDPSRGRRNGFVLLGFSALAVTAYFALGGGELLGWALALAVGVLAAGAMVRVQGEPSAVRFTREGLEFVGARPPKRYRWDEVRDIDLVELPWGLSFGGPKRHDRVVRLSLNPKRATRDGSVGGYGGGGYEVIPTGHGADVDRLAWSIEGWWRYANRPW